MTPNTGSAGNSFARIVAFGLGGIGGILLAFRLLVWMNEAFYGNWVNTGQIVVAAGTILLSLTITYVLVQALAVSNENTLLTGIIAGGLVLSISLILGIGIDRFQSRQALAPYRADQGLAESFANEYQSRYLRAAVREDARTERRRETIDRRTTDDDNSIALNAESNEALQDHFDKLSDRPMSEWIYERGSPESDTRLFQPTSPPDSLSWSVRPGLPLQPIAELTAQWKSVPIRSNEDPLIPPELLDMPSELVELDRWEMYQVEVRELYLFRTPEHPQGRWRFLDASVDITPTYDSIPTSLASDILETLDSK